MLRQPSTQPDKFPAAMQDKLKTELSHLESLGIIEKVVTLTKWVNSMVMVERKDGSIRLCIDPVDLNKSIKQPHYPNSHSGRCHLEATRSQSIHQTWCPIRLLVHSAVWQLFLSHDIQHNLWEIPFQANALRNHLSPRWISAVNGRCFQRPRRIQNHHSMTWIRVWRHPRRTRQMPSRNIGTRPCQGHPIQQREVQVLSIQSKVLQTRHMLWRNAAWPW